VRAFRLHVDRHGDIAAVACVGELDMAEVDGFEDELRRLEDGGPETLVIDLSELTLIDSHGLSALLDADARARGTARQLVLVPPPDPVMQVFRITLLDRRFAWADPDEPAGLPEDLLAALRSLRAAVGREDA
jgi:anti-sigma B factor antagonist